MIGLCVGGGGGEGLSVFLPLVGRHEKKRQEFFCFQCFDFWSVVWASKLGCGLVLFAYSIHFVFWRLDTTRLESEEGAGGGRGLDAPSLSGIFWFFMVGKSDEAAFQALRRCRQERFHV